MTAAGQGALAAAPAADPSGHPAAPAGEPVLRMELLSKDVGWLLITAGMIGVVAPGLPGTPFLIVGVLAVTPGGNRVLARWGGRKPPRFLRGATRTLGRFLEDLEARYPRRP